MADKKIIIDVEDRASKKLAMLKRAMSEAGRAGTQLGRELSRVQPSTKPGGLGALADAILKSEKSLGNLSKMSKETTRAFEDMKNRAIAQQIKMLETWEKRVQKLTHAYNTLGDSIKQFKADPNIQWTEANRSALADLEAKQRRVGIQLGNAQVSVNTLREALGLNGDGIGGFGGGLAGLISGSLARVFGIAGLAWAGKQLFEEYLTKHGNAEIYLRQYALAEMAGAHAYDAPRLQRLFSGDVSEQVAMTNALARARYEEAIDDKTVFESLFREARWTTMGVPFAAYANKILRNEEALRAAAAARAMAKPSSTPGLLIAPDGTPLLDYGWIFAAPFGALSGVQADEMLPKDVQELIETRRQELLAQQMETLKEAAKYEIDVHNEYQRNAGVHAMGIRSLGGLYDRRFDQTGLGVSGNLSVGQALRDAVGENAGLGAFGAAAGLRAMGVDTGIAARTAGFLGQVSGDAQARIEQIFGRAIAKGMSDPRLLELLAGAVTKGVDGAGRFDTTVSAQLVSDASMALGNNELSMHKATSGMDYLDQITSGGATYDVVNRQIALRKALGNSPIARSPMRLTALAQVPLRELIAAANGRMSPRLKNLRITQSEAEAAIKASIRASVESATLMDPALFEAYQRVGLEGILRDPSMKGDLYTALQLRDGADPDAIEGAFEIHLTGSARGWRRQGGAKLVDRASREATVLDMQALVAESEHELSLEVFDTIRDSVQKGYLEDFGKAIGKAVEHMQKGNPDAARYAETLDRINAKLAEFLKRYDQSNGDKALGHLSAEADN